MVVQSTIIRFEDLEPRTNDIFYCYKEKRRKKEKFDV